MGWFKDGKHRENAAQANGQGADKGKGKGKRDGRDQEATDEPDPRKNRDTYVEARKRFIEGKDAMTRGFYDAFSDASGYQYGEAITIDGLTIARDESGKWFPVASQGHTYSAVKGDTVYTTGWILKNMEAEAPPSTDEAFVSWIAVSNASSKVPFAQY
jgi:hypothetical protein